MIGDVLASTVICEALKKRHPNSTIDYLVNTNTLPVIKENPFFDNIIEFKQEYRDDKKKFYAFLKSLKKANYDIAIDAYGKLESNLITQFSGAKRRISYHKWYTYFLYSKTIKRVSKPITTASTSIENRLRLVFEEGKIESNIIKPKIFLTEQEKENAKTFLTNHGITFDRPVLMISVLGSEKRKTLPFEYMAEVIDKIVTTCDAQLLFNYIPNQEEDAKKIYNLTQPKTQKHIFFDVFGKSLRDFISLLSHCDALIGNEGGAVNMAKALGTPTFTIFSPWIIKNNWNMFDDDKKYTSVHLSDFLPELFTDKDTKELKKASLNLYTYFKPQLFLNKMEAFLQKNIPETYLKNKNAITSSLSLQREKVTAIIPTFNEEHNIRGVLESVSFADEIMVVDSYSTDKTVEIAREYTDFIVQREFDYPSFQKNWAIPQANNEWIILVDADERVTPSLRDEILEILKNPGVNDTVGYWIKRMNHFMGQRIHYSGWRNDKVIRLFHRDKCRYDKKHVHEEIETDGKLGILKEKFYHNTYVTLDRHFAKLNKYATWQAEDYNDKTGRLTPYHFILKPFWGFFKHYIIQQGFRDGFVGLTIGYIQGYTVFMRYVKLWLLRRNLK
ncbi:glycosyltransferase family 9 protein [Aquimarina hainanensis]